MKFTIPYPPKKEMAAWNKRFGMNAIYAGKHWAKRSADKEFFHDLVTLHLKQQKIPQKLIPCPVAIYFRWGDNLDIDNHAYLGKLIVDGMKGYLLPDDSKKYYKKLIHEYHDKDYIEVELTEVSDA
jgi:Holliday junction resolvase RusA-like endonuclease